MDIDFQKNGRKRMLQAFGAFAFTLPLVAVAGAGPASAAETRMVKVEFTSYQPIDVDDCGQLFVGSAPASSAREFGKWGGLGQPVCNPTIGVGWKDIDGDDPWCMKRVQEGAGRLWSVHRLVGGGQRHHRARQGGRPGEDPGALRGL
ncbi:hypothetical protein GT755_30295 [Herbidospora sp. NEAU-GS84]|uniref:Uncharacterized protein n=1 Tax=Herbidospora solisilvae TaxID=2696284 RepID=A0A7C9NIB7_9ACTN|nr:hypothetical protein [Herbidospora solisilvae]NAS25955.1 hypothetical protein [Herbidospora solisilvae]